MLFHETGHAIAAWLVRVRIWGIRLGSGPVVWRGRIARCRIQIALFPAVGAVQLLDADAACRLAVFLHGAAGDLAEAREGQVAMTATDLLDHIGEALNSLVRGRLAEES